MKSKIKSIRIRRVEGNVGNRPERTFTDFATAQSWLFSISTDAPKPGNGYDKCDFWIEWENGETYNGRFDLQYGGRDGGDDLETHVRSYIRFLAGLKKPDHMTDEQYSKFTASYKSEALAFLRKQEI